MPLKVTAFLLNFLSFGFLFITLRFLLLYFFPEFGYFLISLLVGIISVITAPRFAVFERNGRETLLMKWIFLKSIREF